MVVRASAAMPRGFDGLIRARGDLDGTGGSMGSVRGAHGKSLHCYTFNAATPNGRLRGDGATSARIGSRHTVTLSTRDAAGQELTDAARVTIRAKRAGDDSGRPLGC